MRASSLTMHDVVRAYVEAEQDAEAAAEVCGLSVKDLRAVLKDPAAKAYLRTIDQQERNRDLVLSPADLARTDGSWDVVSAKAAAVMRAWRSA